ncbi:MAG: YkgJ family cysteine cluster protein [Vulcanisaeta sp.]|jgi:Fe-S-cluster containining protein|nr:YkgJ family cysteine cluster protein [Vulcanisaeta sp.]MCG2869812.1 YkgJ family cysteine cluster protein [Vulcanisaeta sp.]MCG2887062.1 YkgJ family cysteine cluster protein [Vulcanisaeta sp.]
MRLFRCLRCDECCYFDNEERGPILFEDELARLKVLAAERGFEIRYRELVINGVKVYKWLIKGYCPFYDRENRACTIHPIKPLSCRMYPLLYNPNTGEVLISKECRWVSDAINSGEEVGLENFPDETKALEEVLSRLYKIRVRISGNDRITKA